MLADNTISFGLTERDINTISNILKKYPDITEVHIFGSRAKGTQKPSSDIDLAIMNEGVSNSTLLRLKTDLDDSLLPYKVDLVDYYNLSHTELKEHIDRVGVSFYRRVEQV